MSESTHSKTGQYMIVTILLSICFFICMAIWLNLVNYQVISSAGCVFLPVSYDSAKTPDKLPLFQ